MSVECPGCNCFVGNNPFVGRREVPTVTVGAPTNATNGTPFNVTVDSTIHNNGPADPVNTDIAITLNVPPDCSSGSTNPVVLQDQSLLVSQTVNLAQQTYSVTCTGASNHAFTATVAARSTAGLIRSSTRNKPCLPAQHRLGGNADIAVLAIGLSGLLRRSGDIFNVIVTLLFENGRSCRVRGGTLRSRRPRLRRCSENSDSELFRLRFSPVVGFGTQDVG